MSSFSSSFCLILVSKQEKWFLFFRYSQAETSMLEMRTNSDADPAVYLDSSIEREGEKNQHRDTLKEKQHFAFLLFRVYVPTCVCDV